MTTIGTRLLRRTLSWVCIVAAIFSIVLATVYHKELARG